MLNAVIRHRINNLDFTAAVAQQRSPSWAHWWVLLSSSSYLSPGDSPLSSLSLLVACYTVATHDIHKGCSTLFTHIWCHRTSIHAHAHRHSATVQVASPEEESISPELLHRDIYYGNSAVVVVGLWLCLVGVSLTVMLAMQLMTSLDLYLGFSADIWVAILPSGSVPRRLS